MQVTLYIKPLYLSVSLSPHSTFQDLKSRVDATLTDCEVDSFRIGELYFPMFSNVANCTTSETPVVIVASTKKKIHTSKTLVNSPMEDPKQRHCRNCHHPVMGHTKGPNGLKKCDQCKDGVCPQNTTEKQSISDNPVNQKTNGGNPVVHN